MNNKSGLNENDSVKALKEGFISVLQQENDILRGKYNLLEKHITSLNNRIDTLDKECSGYLKEKLAIKTAKESLEIELRELKIENTIIHRELNKIDFTPVKQFNDLYWGDNYPALKELFDFLQKMNCLDINWSYFANNFSLENSEITNLNTTMLSKKEIGYVLAKIKMFFLPDIKGSPSKYKAWVQRKLLVDNSLIDDDFVKNYMRDYKRGKKLSTDNVDLIDSVILKIASKYY
ncbi:hypothetical protein D9O36_02930 [Zobellia amurskyensis]|uniref:Uncharacterized protein n=1 Tax=Zobellia amurskyensis TaxID=248905 RepID=A0A7X3D0C6_9FLAO|nr:hypothetical protein [Zobellia amurskyensis]MUH34786.1 hypothetical protein [Zobellia amurskyensis]